MSLGSTTAFRMRWRFKFPKNGCPVSKLGTWFRCAPTAAAGFLMARGPALLTASYASFPDASSQKSDTGEHTSPRRVLSSITRNTLRMSS